MKKITFFLLSLLVLFVSCDNDTTDIATIQKDSAFKTNVTQTEIDSVNESLKNLFTTTRSNGESEVITEEKAKEALTPLVDNGRVMRDELVNMANAGQLEASSSEIKEMQEMSDADLAGFAYMITVTSKIDDSEFVKVDGQPLQISRDDFFDCLLKAVGLDVFERINDVWQGTKALLTAKTAFTIGKAFIRRTIGWIGIAFTVYEFGSCIHSKSK